MLKATEARAMIEKIREEEVKRVEKEAIELCEKYGQHIAKACEANCDYLIIENIPTTLYKRVCEILIDNGYTLYKVDYRTVKIKW